MKKKLIKLLMVLALAVTLTGCSESSSGIKVTSSAGGIEKVDKIDTYIELGDTINLNGITSGVSVSDNIITIHTGGTYCISGTLNDGQIVVDAKDSSVNLVLNGADITCSSSSPIFIKNSEKTVIALADNSQNTLSDSSEYVYEDESTDEPDSAIYSKDNMVFIGSSGCLTVNGNYNDGIKGKDDLVIEGGNITVNSVNDGITGKDSLLVTNGSLNIDAGKDGLKSSNETDEGKGKVTINGGTINIVSDQDGIQGINNVEINDGEINIITGGGSDNAVVKTEEFGGDMMRMHQNPADLQNDTMGNSPDAQNNTMGNPPELPEGEMMQQPQMPESMENKQGMMNQGSPNGEMNQPQNNSAASDTSESLSSKGIKSDVNLTINGGNITINSCDDSLHTNDIIEINGGTLQISSGDDGIHADSSLNINDGNINISKSYEGIESQVININGGTVYVTSTDDGVNAGGGNDGSSVNGRPGENTFNTSSAASININGGYVYVDADGDGLDSNGSIYMKDGFVIVNGPTTNGNGALDYDNIFDISGGTLISAGSSGMLQATSESSVQNSLKIVMNTLEADTIVRIESEDGKELLTFAPAKSFGSLVVSSPEITSGTSYKVYTGGTCSGESKDGVYESGTYEGGTEIGSGTVSTSVTSINEEGVSVGGMGGHGGMNGVGGMKESGGRQNFMKMTPQNQQ